MQDSKQENNIIDESLENSNMFKKQGKVENKVKKLQ